MKTITLIEAVELLRKCSGVIIDDSVLVYPSVDDLTGEDENEFCYISWDDEGREFSAKFNEGPNQNVKVSGSSMFLIDIDGQEAEITLLQPMVLE